MQRLKTAAAIAPLVLALGLLGGQGVRAHGDADERRLGIQVDTLAASTHQWDGDPLPDYPRSRPEIKILRITIPAGVTLPVHTHPVINAAVITQGRLELQLSSGATRVFEAGEALVEVVNRLHTGRALPGSDVEVIVFYAGTPGTPVTLIQP